MKLVIIGGCVCSQIVLSSTLHQGDRSPVQLKRVKLSLEVSGGAQQTTGPPQTYIWAQFHLFLFEEPIIIQLDFDFLRELRMRNLLLFVNYC